MLFILLIACKSEPGLDSLPTDSVPLPTSKQGIIGLSNNFQGQLTQGSATNWIELGWEADAYRFEAPMEWHDSALERDGSCWGPRPADYESPAQVQIVPLPEIQFHGESIETLTLKEVAWGDGTYDYQWFADEQWSHPPDALSRAGTLMTTNLGDGEAWVPYDPLATSLAAAVEDLNSKGTASITWTPSPLETDWVNVTFGSMHSETDFIYQNCRLPDSGEALIDLVSLGWVPGDTVHVFALSLKNGEHFEGPDGETWLFVNSFSYFML